MKKYFHFFLLLVAIAAFSLVESLAGIYVSESLKPTDYDVVQTISYDSIYSRSGIFKFPDNTDNYRKIIMLYTLKCDVNTLRDQYNCGEWDYDTYTFIRSHTGIYDSSLVRVPLYRLGNVAPKTIKYSSTAQRNTLRKTYSERIIDNTKAEREFQITPGTQEIALSANACKFQFVISSDDISTIGMQDNDSINGIKLYFKEGGITLKGFSIRVRQVNSSEITTFNNMKNILPAFRNDVSIVAGENKFRFPQKVEMGSYGNFVVEISYESATPKQPILLGTASPASVYSTSITSSYRFDGKTDFVNCGKFPEFNNAQALTIEAWVKIDKWQNWGTIANFDDRVGLQLSDVEGEIYCMARNNDNNVCYGSSAALTSGGWVHIAMSYDGTQAVPNNRMKLFIDGKQISLSYRKGDFSWKIPPNLQYVLPNFIIGGTTNYNSMFKGNIKEVRVWKQALTKATLTDWMNKPITSEHPDFASLAAWYDLGTRTDLTIADKSAKARDGKMFGMPEFITDRAIDINKDVQSIAARPNFGTFQGEYNSHLVSTTKDEDVVQKPSLLAKYAINAKTPEIIQSEIVWADPYSYTIDEVSGNHIDSVAIAHSKTIENDSLSYYSVPVERVVRHEIARFITPYGKAGLPQLDNGFTWAYDVTDYAQLLKGNVDITAHNYQELVDVKFVFIKGTAPRPVVALNQIWGGLLNPLYKDLAADSALKPIEMPLVDGATQFKLKARITGHGQQSTNGSYPYCCEWKDNTHYMSVDGTQVAKWHVYTTDDCRTNAVFPQAGTWPAEREGWCPGYLVRDRNFNITNYVTNRKPVIDYSITPVPKNNLGMGNGDYKMSFYLVQYGPSAHANDAEIYNIITPNKEPYYSRVNPICSNPRVEIRNNGTSNLTSLKFTYSVSGGAAETYSWTGTIEPNEIAEVALPVSGSDFWLGNDERLFTVNISEPNGVQDEYTANDSYSTHFNLPDLISKGAVFVYKTNNVPSMYNYVIKDMNGNTVVNRNDTEANTIYYDTLNFDPGCYTFSITEPNYGYGLSYWAVDGLGSGYVNIIEQGTNRVIKAFEPNFGLSCIYSFFLDKYTRVEEPSLNNMMNVFPVPATDFVNVTVSTDFGQSTVELIDMRGAKVFSAKNNFTTGAAFQIPTAALANGVYIININNGKETISNQFLKKK